ncbi:hypothetical protein VSH64_36610 [Amycolatopsis rhabdoformis]|uniref:PE domain-containing protein n=1 Tax=Amycolatopsis rhabdoformis TaxID=1448059 RepID=A0ABZ1I1P9_9PSEU|nr:hypothetical protein [Amycolatopsis rhabdoformis]WSE28320.1 hypothetical protein VSH64_36610 [Amycolatopsis rhabdoformis]
MSDVPPTPPIKVGSYGTGGGYQFNDDEVDGVINQWQALADNLKTDLGRATTIAQVKAPADEFASGDFVKGGANPSGQTLLDQHQRMVDYVNNFITALKAAKNKITVAEQHARDNIKTGA